MSDSENDSVMLTGIARARQERQYQRLRINDLESVDRYLQHGYQSFIMVIGPFHKPNDPIIQGVALWQFDDEEVIQKLVEATCDMLDYQVRLYQITFNNAIQTLIVRHATPTFITVMFTEILQVFQHIVLILKEIIQYYSNFKRVLSRVTSEDIYNTLSPMQQEVTIKADRIVTTLERRCGRQQFIDKIYLLYVNIKDKYTNLYNIRQIIAEREDIRRRNEASEYSSDSTISDDEQMGGMMEEDSSGVTDQETLSSFDILPGFPELDIPIAPILPPDGEPVEPNFLDLGDEIEDNFEQELLEENPDNVENILENLGNAIDNLADDSFGSEMDVEQMMGPMNDDDFDHVVEPLNINDLEVPSGHNATDSQSYPSGQTNSTNNTNNTNNTNSTNSTNTPQFGGDRTTCSICMDAVSLDNDENILNNTRDIKLSCGHVFHKLCLGQWVLRHNLCPDCRREINNGVILSLRFLYRQHNQPQSEPSSQVFPSLPDLNQNEDNIGIPEFITNPRFVEPNEARNRRRRLPIMRDRRGNQRYIPNPAYSAANTGSPGSRLLPTRQINERVELYRPRYMMNNESLIDDNINFRDQRPNTSANEEDMDNLISETQSLDLEPEEQQQIEPEPEPEEQSDIDGLLSGLYPPIQRNSPELSLRSNSTVMSWDTDSEDEYDDNIDFRNQRPHEGGTRQVRDGMLKEDDPIDILELRIDDRDSFGVILGSIDQILEDTRRQDVNENEILNVFKEQIRDLLEFYVEYPICRELLIKRFRWLISPNRKEDYPEFYSEMISQLDGVIHGYLVYLLERFGEEGFRVLLSSNAIEELTKLRYEISIRNNEENRLLRDRFS